MLQERLNELVKSQPELCSLRKRSRTDAALPSRPASKRERRLLEGELQSLDDSISSLSGGDETDTESADRVGVEDDWTSEIEFLMQNVQVQEPDAPSYIN
jgi:hypothetical protein